MPPRSIAPTAAQTENKTIWCAVYTRKSTDENLDTDFNSLDSQREYCQSFVKSREGIGWKVYAEEYNDPGFTGGNMNRPALKKMLADAMKGKFQVLVAYKYDRLSRNTRDFLQILDTFDRHGVAFVSVTQPIDTTSSVGRLMRSILMDFSQFEREMISERTRDKLHAMALKGKRPGGFPILGYNINPENKRLEINPEESKQVLEMFETYRQTRSLSTTAHALNKKGIHMKLWTTKEGMPKGGQKFNKVAVWNLLRNPLYIGKITHRKEVLPGEHQGIVPEPLFEAVDKLLLANGDGKTNKRYVERTHHFLLRGLVQCAVCGTTMTPSTALPRNGQRFYYYKCLSVVKMDGTACTVRSVPAKALEDYVIKRLELISEKQEIIERIVKNAQQTSTQELPGKIDERKRFIAELGKIDLETKNLVSHLGKAGPESIVFRHVSERLAEMEPKRKEIGVKIDQLDFEIRHLEERQIEADVIRQGLKNFLKLFEKLKPEERVELIQLLVERVIWDKTKSAVRIALRPLPEIWGNMEALEGLFYDRLKLLPASNGHRTDLKHFNPLLDPRIALAGFPCLWDESIFDQVNGAKGAIRILFPPEAQAVRDRQRRYKPPRPPPIQGLLQRADELKQQLDTTPGLTRFALAKNLRLDPSRITQILNLLNLAPQIKAYIKKLPPTKSHDPIGDGQWMRLARILDHARQIREFEALCQGTGLPIANLIAR